MSRLTVLNTRPSGQAAELSKLLRAANLDVVEAPAIAIESAWDPAELAAVRRDLPRFAHVVLASMNAGRDLAADLRSTHVDILCGASTAAALGLTNVATLERFSAGAALEALRPRVRAGERVLVPRAAEGRDELIDGLVRLGIRVDAPIAYRTVPTSEAAVRLHQGSIDIVAVCSPSAVRAVAAALQPRVRLACLGRTTAAAAEALHIRVDAVAERTSMASLVAAIESLAGARV